MASLNGPTSTGGLSGKTGIAGKLPAYLTLCLSIMKYQGEGGRSCSVVQDVMRSEVIREIRKQLGHSLSSGAKTTVFNYSRDFFVRCLSLTTWYPGILNIPAHLLIQPSQSVLPSLPLHTNTNSGLWISFWCLCYITKTSFYCSQQNNLVNDMHFRLICFHVLQ